jgi:hypothetical protein
MAMVEEFGCYKSISIFSFAVSKHIYITDSEMLALTEKTNRHMRIRELLLQYSKESTFIVM